MSGCFEKAADQAHAGGRQYAADMHGMVIIGDYFYLETIIVRSLAVNSLDCDVV